jgi:predicted O-methyltransferase YrrM
MLERHTDPRFQSIATPCEHAVELASRVLAGKRDPTIAEIGVGIGATSLALCRTLDHRGEAWFFDFEDRVEELGADLARAGFNNVKLIGNSRRTFDGYGWTLALLLRQQRARSKGGLFDFIYLDGAHLYHHDALATVCAKDLLNVGGYLLVNGYEWTIDSSPTLRPAVNPAVCEQYSDTQIELSHVEMVCSLLLDDDAHFARIPLDAEGRERRRAYQKTA